MTQDYRINTFGLTQKQNQFVSANLTFIFTKDKYSTVFLDYDKQRMAVLRPYNESL